MWMSLGGLSAKGSQKVIQMKLGTYQIERGEATVEVEAEAEVKAGHLEIQGGEGAASVLLLGKGDDGADPAVDLHGGGGVTAGHRHEISGGEAQGEEIGIGEVIEGFRKEEEEVEEEVDLMFASIMQEEGVLEVVHAGTFIRRGKL